MRRAPAQPAAPARVRTTAPARPTAPVRRPAPQPAVPPPPAPTVAEPAQLEGTLPIVADQFATVTVIPAGEIERSPAQNLGDVMFTKPGITSTTTAPGASRPVIRGQDNFRVRIQENGIASGDVSDTGEDHAVTIDPLVANRIEVIRGPATLRWGSQAIGGVVEVDNNRIPTWIPPGGFSALMKGGATTVDNGVEGAVLLDAGRGNFAFHADAFGRRADDYRIPGYPYLFPPDPAPLVNGRQPNTALRTGGSSVGGSYLFDGGFVGVAVSHFASLYRIPGIEATETGTRIDLHQTKVTSKGEFRPQASAIDAIRFWLGASDYKHDELAFENGFDGVQQTFTNKTAGGPNGGPVGADQPVVRGTHQCARSAGQQCEAHGPGSRRWPVRPEPNDDGRGLHLQRAQVHRLVQDAGGGPHRAGQREGIGARPSCRPLGQHRPQPQLHAEKRRRRLPPRPALGDGREPDRAIRGAGATRSGAPVAGRSTRRPGPSTSAIRISISRSPDPSKPASGAPRGRSASRPLRTTPNSRTSSSAA